MAHEVISYYNKCPDCGCDRTLVDYNYVDIVKQFVGKGVRCESCMTRWRTAKILSKAQRKANQIRPHLVLVA